VRSISWSSKSQRAFKRVVRRNPQLRSRIEEVLNLLVEDPFNPSLDTHKLKGDLANVWACSVESDFRILFEFLKDPEGGEDVILLFNIGTHDEVY
jgi:addiction module RelE/StbE family toxin